jgi:hypothetical protein
MIDNTLDVGLESGGKLFCERLLRITVDACQQAIISSLKHRYVEISLVREIVIHRRSRHACAGDDVLHRHIFIRFFRE